MRRQKAWSGLDPSISWKPMKETTTKRKNSRITIGLDLGDRKHSYCVLNDKGETIKEGI
jgi:hypothetical protein